MFIWEGKPTLKVNSIDVFYGKFQALWNISIKVGERELVAIVGSNCAGKTTILKTIAGILRPKIGSIDFLNVRLDTLPAYKICELGISLMPEGRRLFPYMSVLENLEMGAYTKKAREKMEDTLELVYNLFPVLKDRKSQMAGTLSGGEQQMLAIGRALMSRPKLLMLDEPSLGLAPKYVGEIFRVVQKLNEDEKVTILLVEQNVKASLKMANRAYVIETGRIIKEGKSEDLLKDEHVKKAYLGM